VLLIGLVNLFADMSYEGVKSITGPFLTFLEASAFVIGVVAGVEEFVGYTLRIVFGYLSDRTGRYLTTQIEDG
jgi:MFS family permease